MAQHLALKKPLSYCIIVQFFILNNLKHCFDIHKNVHLFPATSDCNLSLIQNQINNKLASKGDKIAGVTNSKNKKNLKTQAQLHLLRSIY